MEHNYFIFSDSTSEIEIERFHICTWEFKDDSALIEFGGEIKCPTELKNDYINIYIYIPWITKKHTIKDLYDNLKDSENSRFIFNDSVTGNIFLDDGKKKNGVIQEFTGRTPLCIMPITSSFNEGTKLIKINISLKHFQGIQNKDKTNLYFRFYIEPNVNLLSTRKSGIGRTTIIYDIKINEKRNLPADSAAEMNELIMCKINSCFFFNILPNSYDLTFFDTSSLKNVRTLESDSFKRYLGDKRVKDNELVVVFNKKKSENSYTFFSIYSKERIGTGQFALAVLGNLICGILLFIPSYRKSLGFGFFSKDLWLNLPIEVFISVLIGLIIVTYFIWPQIINLFVSIKKILHINKN